MLPTIFHSFYFQLSFRLEHLDHLLGCNSSRQFHGGDYLSAESSSSLSSVESSKPRLAPRTKPLIPPNSITEDKHIERKEKGESDISTQQFTKVDKGEGDPPKTLVNVDDRAETELNPHQNQNASPLWSLEPRIFATEKGNGKRKYLVGEFGRIADWYWRKTAPASRHLYEVIREGSPCRLYFDLEYSKLYNSSVPETKLLRELEDELATELQLHYGKFLPRLKPSQIVNLDSSNEKKFSRHWVVHLFGDDSDSGGESGSNRSQEFLFKDAPTVGRFVKRMVGRLADDMAAEEEEFAKNRPALAKHLFVNTKDPAKQTCFIDLGVYTRNRLFRCLESSKKGKSTTLRVVLRESLSKSKTETSQLQTKTDNDNEKRPSCTVEERCYFPICIPDKKEIDSSQSSSSNTPAMKSFIAGNDWEPHAQALADSLVVPLKNPFLEQDSILQKKNPNRILNVDIGSCISNSLTRYTDTSGNPTQSRFPPATSMARQGSPIPALDQYVTENLASRGGVRGSIRAWSIEYGPRDTPASFTYHLQRNRFCEIIGRSHKSNNVFWTIDLNSWTCIQGCHDPDCFGRGSPISISNNSLVAGQQRQGGRQLDRIRKEFDSWQEEEFEKALGELNLDDIIVAAPIESETKQLGHEETKKSEEDSEDLSDDALLQAIVDNPELFP